MRALVLSGGGARGAYEAGVASALLERENFDVVCGTSIGAVNGALAAQGSPSALRALWMAIPQRRLVRGTVPIEAWRALFGGDVRALGRALRAVPDLVLPARIKRWRSVLDPAPIVEVLDELLDVKALQRSLVVTATNLTLGRSEAFYRFTGSDAAERAAAFAAAEPTSAPLDDARYRLAILASAAMPLAYPSVEMPGTDGRSYAYVDGGVGNNTPLRQAIDAGADDITVVVADHVALRDQAMPLDDLASIGLAAQDLLQQRVLELDLNLLHTINEAVLHGAAPGKRFVTLRTIGPSVPVALPMLAFADPRAVAAAFEQGYGDGRHARVGGDLDAMLAQDPRAFDVDAAATIFREGDPGDLMYVVLSGTVVLSSRTRELARVGAGSMFGELALIDRRPRSASAVACGPVRIAPIDRVRFAYLVRFAPHFALDVLRTLSARLQATGPPR